MLKKIIIFSERNTEFQKKLTIVKTFSNLIIRITFYVPNFVFLKQIQVYKTIHNHFNK